MALKCKAKKRSGEPCKAYAMHGQTVCQKHGGKTPVALAAAQRRLAEQEAYGAIAKLGDARPLESIQDVYTELLTVAGTARQWRELLQERVTRLRRLGRDTEFAGTQLKADVILFERALDRSAKIGEALVRLNLEERRQALDERTAAALVAVVRTILEDLQLSSEQQAAAKKAVPRRLRELTA